MPQTRSLFGILLLLPSDWRLAGNSRLFVQISMHALLKFNCDLHRLCSCPNCRCPPHLLTLPNLTWQLSQTPPHASVSSCFGKYKLHISMSPGASASCVLHLHVCLYLQLRQTPHQLTFGAARSYVNVINVSKYIVFYDTTLLQYGHCPGQVLFSPGFYKTYSSE